MSIPEQGEGEKGKEGEGRGEWGKDRGREEEKKERLIGTLKVKKIKNDISKIVNNR